MDSAAASVGAANIERNFSMQNTAPCFPRLSRAWKRGPGAWSRCMAATQQQSQGIMKTTTGSEIAMS